ncbi:ethanolamine ammonia-lyase subunit EutC [Pseudomonas stutzeri]|uniref:ethanolamine ammonia-lyase subunit EutC n=1 Tax=Stutzerimonas stutzeri TaxID=316 RepID=UPI000C9BA128|nr:ethanolamine ammonia-lyase subunit EutC [Stutzerimonas stutzeri]MCQ4278635.1 ethanolamine ammonia-lyase subunit EutC [Stutzerimonas stutzeri]PNF72383.1 ethanolamine ammonia-lyase [Stutzerimonas stutzeri]
MSRPPPAPTAITNPWAHLRQHTPARIALGRAGASLPTEAQLDFQFAHAQARDAVHLTLDTGALAMQLEQRGHRVLQLHSAAPDRDTYLQRPDLGRRLSDESAERVDTHAQQQEAGYDLAIVIADGLSALAVQRHALPLLQRIEEQIEKDGWSLAPISLVQQSRVALGDEVGERLKAKMVVMLLGERPGLSSPDSLGLYFTYAPKVGRTDADRNCISNIRLEGLSYNLAAHRLIHLMREACRRQLSGVNLKDEAEMLSLDDGTPKVGNFLLG